jgi:hypothetical protein
VSEAPTPSQLSSLLGSWACPRYHCCPPHSLASPCHASREQIQVRQEMHLTILDTEAPAISHTNASSSLNTLTVLMDSRNLLGTNGLSEHANTLLEPINTLESHTTPTPCIVHAPTMSGCKYKWMQNNVEYVGKRLTNRRSTLVCD